MKSNYIFEKGRTLSGKNSQQLAQVKKLPDFIICGAQKSGTTSLWYYLSQHPQIFIPEIKEVDYFSDNFSKGLNWYTSFFSQAKQGQIVGEVSPGYMMHSEIVAGRMHQLLPNIKLIFILRNPVDRAYSVFLFNIQRGKYVDHHKKTFEEILLEPRGKGYLSNGEYMRQIQQFLKYYNKKNMLFLIFEDFVKNLSREVEKIINFLGLEEFTFLSEVKNKTRVLRFNRISPIIGKFTNYLQFIPEPIKVIIRSLIYKAGNYSPLTEELRRQLIEYYKPHNDSLAEFLKRDLSIWNKW